MRKLLSALVVLCAFPFAASACDYGQAIVLPQTSYYVQPLVQQTYVQPLVQRQVRVQRYVQRQVFQQQAYVQPQVFQQRTYVQPLAQRQVFKQRVFVQQQRPLVNVDVRRGLFGRTRIRIGR